MNYTLFLNRVLECASYMTDIVFHCCAYNYSTVVEAKALKLCDKSSSRNSTKNQRQWHRKFPRSQKRSPANIPVSDDTKKSLESLFPFSSRSELLFSHQRPTLIHFMLRLNGGKCYAQNKYLRCSAQRILEKNMSQKLINICTSKYNWPLLPAPKAKKPKVK